MSFNKETVGVASQLVNYGMAIKALKEGKRVRESTWPEDRKFVFMQVPSNVPEKYVAGMSSLPQSVKDYFAWTFTEDSGEQIDSLYYNNQLALVSSSNSISSYSPSVIDSMSDNWIILD